MSQCSSSSPRILHSVSSCSSVSSMSSSVSSSSTSRPLAEELHCDEVLPPLLPKLPEYKSNAESVWNRLTDQHASVCGWANEDSDAMPVNWCDYCRPSLLYFLKIAIAEVDAKGKSLHPNVLMVCLNIAHRKHAVPVAQCKESPCKGMFAEWWTANKAVVDLENRNRQLTGSPPDGRWVGSFSEQEAAKEECKVGELGASHSNAPRLPRINWLGSQSYVLSQLPLITLYGEAFEFLSSFR